MVGHPRDDGIEDVADLALHGDGGKALRHFALDFSGGIFLLRAVCGDAVSSSSEYGLLLSSEHCFDQSLRDHIGKSPVRRGGVRVVLNREPEVSGRNDRPGVRGRIRRGR